MKSKIYTALCYAFLILIFTTLNPTTNYSQPQNVLDDTITVTGIVIADEDILKSTKVNVYMQDDLVISKVLDDNKFSLRIPVNEMCTVVFSQPNFIGKCIVFDMYTEVEVKNLDPFDLEVHLLSENMYEKGNMSNLDFPVGIVQIDPVNNVLYYEELYSDFIWQFHTTMLKEQTILK